MDIFLIPIEKRPGFPISQQIVELVLRNIQINRLQPGDRLPTERDLAQQLGVARGTVKQAYKKLEQMQVLQVRQGSGSFVKRNDSLAEEVRQQQIGRITEQYISQLLELAVRPDEIKWLVEQHLSKDTHKPAEVAVVYSNMEMLLDFKRQLSTLPDIAVSIFILDSIIEDPDPQRLLGSFSLIVAPSDCYEQVERTIPGLRERMIEASIAPDNETLVRITALPRDCRIGIISRTSAFLSVVKDVLISFGFESENILSFFEMHYTVETYFPGGIHTLISFRDAHIFTDPAFLFRNEELLAKGGTIIAFQHQLERGSIRHIGERLQNLRHQKVRGDPQR